MSNNQALSPQGYNITDAPVNTNPFFDDEDTDPSVEIRLTALENEYTDLSANKADKTQLNNYYTKSEINTQNTTINERLTNDESTINGHTNSIESIENSIEDISDDLGNLTNDVNTIKNTTIPAIQSSLNNKANTSDLTSINNRLLSVEQIQATQGSTIDTINETTGQLSEDVGSMENILNDAVDDITGLQGALNSKANSSDVYTKQQVDALIPDTTGFMTDDDLQQTLSDYYTKSEVDGLISQSTIDPDNYYTKSEVYNKTEIDAIIGDINSVLEVVLNGNN